MKVKFNDFMFERVKEQPDIINSILDKISDIGYKNISPLEKEILDRYSKGGEKAIDEFIESSDEEITFDKGQILVGGVPYEEYQRKEKEGKLDPTKYQRTSVSGGGGPYKIRVYKKYGEKNRYYYIFHENATKQIYRPIPTEEKGKNIFGEFVTLKGYDDKSMEDTHKLLVERHSYDEFRDLTPKELGDFYTMLSLRLNFKKKKD